MNIIYTSLLEDYKEKQKITLLKHLNKLERDAKNVDFDFYATYSAVHSSNIEGNIMDFDTFTKFRLSGMNTQGKSYKEIDDLRKSYLYAKENELNLKNFLKAHQIASQTIVEDRKYKGKYRDVKVFVVKNGKIIFTGCPASEVKNEMDLLFEDINTLLNRNLTLTESFYYASMIHLCFVQIHPFADGNGRTARLLEKWFLSQKIGFRAWFIPSEKLYHKRINQYYKNVNIGDTYDTIQYKYALPFLLMLPMALTSKR